MAEHTHWLMRGEVVERLEQAIRVMEGLSPHVREKHLNMGVWGTKNECGTSACVAGFCAMDSWFNARGFDHAWQTEMARHGREIVHMVFPGVRPQRFFGNRVADVVFMGGGGYDQVMDTMKALLYDIKIKEGAY